MLQGNMKKKEHKFHITQKPVALYDWILSKYAKPGNKILDTHVGSASSLVACIEAGYEFLGFELDKHYCELAQQRVSVALSQFSLFKGVDYNGQCKIKHNN